MTDSTPFVTDPEISDIPFAPKPEVVYLLSLFRSIRAGKIRIPAFQRGFVWKPGQVVKLLESVYQSYPVGSLLFWRADASMMRIDTGENIPFPNIDVEGQVDFVLDGMQRLSSLYGAFYKWAPDLPPKKDPFAVAFDLHDETFVPLSERNKYCIDLRDVFSPKTFVRKQAELAELPDGDFLLDRAIALQSTFQEYLLPIVTIGDREVDEVVEIFERVNSTGMNLSAIDFMRALTWSEEFDLNHANRSIMESEELQAFSIPEDTIAKCISLEAGILPTSKEIVALRGKEVEELDAATKSARSALCRVGKFLEERMQFHSYDYIPYEGQLLVMVSAATGLDDQEPLPNWVEPWLWNVGFSESLQGRPDRTIANMAAEVRRRPDVPLREHFSLTKESLITRALRKHASLSMTVVAALATVPAHSVISGERMDADDFTAGYNANFIGTIFSRAEIEAAVTPSPQTDKVIANVVLLGPSERRPRRSPESIRKGIIDLARNTSGRKALATQCIDDKCISALKSMDCLEFLDCRAKLIIARAKALAQVT